VTLQVEERDGQQRAVLLEPAHHGLLALRREHEALRAHARERRHGAADLLACDLPQRARRRRQARLRHHAVHGKGVDAAVAGQVLAAQHAGPDDDRVCARVRVLGRLERDRGEAEERLGGVEGDAGSVWLRQ